MFIYVTMQRKYKIDYDCIQNVSLTNTLSPLCSLTIIITYISLADLNQNDIYRLIYAVS